MACPWVWLAASTSLVMPRALAPGPRLPTLDIPPPVLCRELVCVAGPRAGTRGPCEPRRENRMLPGKS